MTTSGGPACKRARNPAITAWWCELISERRRVERVLAEFVIFQSSVGLNGGAQGKVRREGVIHKGDIPLRGVVSNLFRGGDAADAAGVDLDVTDAAVVDHVFGLVKIVAAFTAGKANFA